MKKMKAFGKTWLWGLKILFKVFVLIFFLRLLYGLGVFSVMFIAAGLAEVVGEDAAFYFVLSVASILGLLSVPFMVAVMAEHVGLKG